MTPPPIGDRQVLSALLHRLGSPLGALVNYAHLADGGSHADPVVGDAWRGMHSALGDAREALEGARRWLGVAEATAAPVQAALADVWDGVRRQAPAGLEVTLGHLAEPQEPCPALATELILEILAHALAGGAHQADVAARIHADRLEVTVQDDGACLTPAEWKRAFAPFGRVLSTVRPQESSTASASGMGLPIVAAGVHGLGGEVWAEPDRPRGTRIVLALPRTPQAAKETACR